MNYEDALTGFDRARVRNVLQQKYYLNFALTEDIRVLYENCASEIVSCFLKLFMDYKNICLSEKDVDICCNYLFDDGESIEGLGRKYNLTQDNIRHTIVDVRKKLRYSYNYRNGYINDIDFCLTKIPLEGLVQFIASGLLARYSRRMTSFILQCLFNELSEALLSAAESLGCTRSVVFDSTAEEFVSKACFIGEAEAKIQFDEITSVADPIEFRGNERAFLRLSQSAGVRKIIRYPNIVYYRTGTTEHTPACCLLTNDNKIILVVFSPTLNMAVHYNLVRFRALHAFCRQNGLGYIIANENFSAITDIKNTAMNAALRKKLLSVLDKNGVITKDDVINLKRQFKVTDSVIAAFVINNKLKFTITPYEIKRTALK